MQKRAEATRKDILLAAETSFARSGYDATGVAEICKQAEISKGAFYHHFASKHAVFVELMETWLSDLEIQLLTIEKEADSVPEGLLTMASMMRKVFEIADQNLPLFLEFWGKAIREKEIRDAAMRPYANYYELFVNLMEQGRKEGTIDTVDPEEAANVIISFAIGLLLQSLLLPKGVDWTQKAHDGLRIILNGLKKKEIV